MARTKQTARRSTGAKAPMKQLASRAFRKNIQNRQLNQNNNNAIDIEEEEGEEEEEIQQEEDSKNNVFGLKFDDQIECEQQAIQAKIIFCDSCQAIFNSESKLLTNQQYNEFKNKILDKQKIELEINAVAEKHEKEEEQKINAEKEQKQLQNVLNDAIVQQFIEINENQKVWICEFCEHHNKLDENTIVPAKQNECYLVMTREQVLAEESKNNNNQDLKKNNKEFDKDSDISIIFCVDVSGSMDTPIQLSNQQANIKQKQKSPPTKKTCVINALLQELEKIKESYPNRKIGLVEFSNNVTLIGDGLGKPIEYKDKLLDNYNQVLEKTQTHYDKLLSNTISASYKAITTQLMQFKSGGATALGPALLSSIALASQGKPGSKVIICTDGLANMGLGNLEDPKSLSESEEFYTQVGEYAKSQGIPVSIITVKGAGANIKNLSKVSDLTSGTVSRVDGDNLSQDLASILQDQIIGINAEIKIRLNKAIQFVNENVKFLSDEGSMYANKIGNFRADTELFYQFQFKSAKQLIDQNININLCKRDKIFMQAQITYLNLNKDKFLQVFTDWRENAGLEDGAQQQLNDLSQQQQMIQEEDLDFGIIAARAQQEVANLATKGQYDKGLETLKNWNTYINQNFGNNKAYASKLKQFQESQAEIEQRLLRRGIKKQDYKAKKQLQKQIVDNDDSSSDESSNSSEENENEQQIQGSRGRGGRGGSRGGRGGGSRGGSNNVRRRTRSKKKKQARQSRSRSKSRDRSRSRSCSQQNESDDEDHLKIFQNTKIKSSQWV